MFLASIIAHKYDTSFMLNCLLCVGSRVDDSTGCECSRSQKPCSEKSACRCKRRPCTRECNCWCEIGRQSRKVDGSWSSDEESVQSTNGSISGYRDEDTIEQPGPASPSPIDPELRQRIEGVIVNPEQCSEGFSSVIGMKDLKDRLQNQVSSHR